jgi:NADPH:quinone reductase
MKAVTFFKSLPISAPESLVDVEIERPVPGPHDLLVQVYAISVNPVDAKIRSGGGPRNAADTKQKLLGWDAAGVVIETGNAAKQFKIGDEVYYAGAIDRSGTYGEFHVVDERLVGRKPARLNFAEAAALPLTTITAWEMLFDRINLRPDNNTRGALLIIGGAGGVGSISIQLARCLTGLNVIATASRAETRDWCLELGAHHVIDHRQPLAEQIKAIEAGGVNYVLGLTKTEDYYEQIIEAMAPQGALALIENVARPIDINQLKPKSISLHWEFIFARSRYQTADMSEQGRILSRVATLIDQGRIRSTMRENFGQINAANLKHAHAVVESGKSIGKIVLEGFETPFSTRKKQTLANPIESAHLLTPRLTTATTQRPIHSGFNSASTTADVIKGIDLVGKLAIVTGGYSGLGRETVRTLLRAGARVIVPARDVTRAMAALSALPNVQIEPMDLLDPASIDAFAERFLASAQPLHILVNSAAIMAGPLGRDRRGFEHQFSTNHLGHFQLTTRLSAALQRARGARVVSVASRGHWFSPVNFKDPNFEHRPYDPWLAYGQSKTANILFAVELHRRGQGHGVHAFSAHPGAILETGLAKHVAPEIIRKAGAVDEHGKPVINPAKGLKTVEQGASTIVWCATSPRLNEMGGVYCEDNDVARLNEGRSDLSSPSSVSVEQKGVMGYAIAPDNARRLWTLSEELLGFQADF